MSIEPVDALLDVMGTVGVSPNEGLVAGLAEGIGSPGTGGAEGTSNDGACDKLPGDGSGATDATGGGGGGAGSPPSAGACATDCDGAECGSGGGACEAATGSEPDGGGGGAPR